jgi:hypothetical protein
MNEKQKISLFLVDEYTRKPTALEVGDRIVLNLEQEYVQLWRDTPSPHRLLVLNGRDDKIFFPFALKQHWVIVVSFVTYLTGFDLESVDVGNEHTYTYLVIRRTPAT